MALEASTQRKCLKRRHLVERGNRDATETAHYIEGSIERTCESEMLLYPLRFDKRHESLGLKRSCSGSIFSLRFALVILFGSAGL
jgi:hypothetical protein